MENPPSPRIHVLPAQLVNQIAAGEVVDRPASVVKELLENSLDAGADQLDIGVEGGGIRAIRVRDNGCGMSADDLALCLERHATSKISSMDDLERVASLGFRGEALAAMASVSRMKITTRQRDAAQGAQLLAVAGERQAIRPAAHPAGTSIELEELFFNVPARRKFLKAERSELLALQDSVKTTALSRFDVAFKLTHADKTLLQLPQALSEQARHQRVAEILGEGFLQESLYLVQADLGLQLHGWIGLPTFNRAHSGAQYFFVNGRPVRDKIVSHAVRQAFEDVLFKGRHPAFVLYLGMDPANVDVNVHPTKQEVRFRDGRLVHDFLFRTLHRAIANHRPQAVAAPVPVMAEAIALAPPPQQVPLQLREPGSPGYWDALVRPAMREAPSSKPEVPAQQPEAAPVALGHAIGQIRNRFILAENAEGLVLVDQHAAHERVIYESMKQAAGTELQSLLVPLTLTLTPTQMALWEAHQAVFQQAGFDCSPLSADTLALRSVPKRLQGLDLGELFADMLADVQILGDSRRADGMVNNILGNMACRAAIKTSRRLSLEEMDALLRQMEHTPRFGQCNHGRPTYVQVTEAELDRLFLRGR